MTILRLIPPMVRSVKIIDVVSDSYEKNKKFCILTR